MEQTQQSHMESLTGSDLFAKLHTLLIFQDYHNVTHLSLDNSHLAPHRHVLFATRLRETIDVHTIPK